MFNWDRVGLIVLFFIPALWQGQSANPTLFYQNLGDGCEFFVIVPPIFLCRGVEAHGLCASADAVSALSSGKHGKNQDQNQEWPHRPTTRKVSLGFADQLATVPPLEKLI